MIDFHRALRFPIGKPRDDGLTHLQLCGRMHYGATLASCVMLYPRPSTANGLSDSILPASRRQPAFAICRAIRDRSESLRMRQFIEPAAAIMDQVERPAKRPLLAIRIEAARSNGTPHCAGRACDRDTRASERVISSAAGTTRSAASLGVSARTSATRSAQRDIDLVPDGGHRRNLRCRDRSHDRLFVERPQIFQAAAAAADDEHIGRRRKPIRQPNAGHNFLRRAVALHASRNDQHIHAPPPPPQALPENRAPPHPVGLVTNATRRGNAGSLAVSCRIEQPFGRQLLAQAFAARVPAPRRPCGCN